MYSVCSTEQRDGYGFPTGETEQTREKSGACGSKEGGLSVVAISFQVLSEQAVDLSFSTRAIGPESK